jgi:hypothetical protein
VAETSSPPQEVVVSDHRMTRMMVRRSPLTPEGPRETPSRKACRFSREVSGRRSADDSEPIRLKCQASHLDNVRN